MIVGIDAGGTNVDAALVDDGVVATAKVPADRTDALERTLEQLLDGASGPVDRVVVATTRALNAAVQGRLPECTAVLVPGPGLAPERAFFAGENHVAGGCVDHRGRVTEDLEYDRQPASEAVAAVGKFSPRNPALEEALRDQFDGEVAVALGSAAGPGLTFPERSATTVANAKTRPTVDAYAEAVAAATTAAGLDAPTYYLKGDAAMLDGETVRATPAHTLRGGPAASALGLRALAGVETAVCLDVGGTTTDVTRVASGRPATERGAEVGDLETAYEGVASRDLPVGGDTLVTDAGLARRREGPAAAFGGDRPTLTDALVVRGALDGGSTASGDGDQADAGAAVRAFEAFEDPAGHARAVVEAYVERAADAVAAAAGEFDGGGDDVGGDGAATLVAGGVLAPALAPRVARAADGVGRVVVPEHAGVAGAVGCAVARVSVRTAVHVDSARGTGTVTAAGGTRRLDVEAGRQFDDEAVRTLAVEQARTAAGEADGRRNGEADAADVTDDVEVLDARAFDVVENSRVRGQVVDAVAQVRPGVRRPLDVGRLLDEEVSGR